MSDTFYKYFLDKRKKKSDLFPTYLVYIHCPTLSTGHGNYRFVNPIGWFAIKWESLERRKTKLSILYFEPATTVYVRTYSVIIVGYRAAGFTIFVLIWNRWISLWNIYFLDFFPSSMVLNLSNLKIMIIIHMRDNLIWFTNKTRMCAGNTKLYTSSRVAVVK